MYESDVKTIPIDQPKFILLQLNYQAHGKVLGHSMIKRKGTRAVSGDEFARAILHPCLDLFILAFMFYPF